MYEMKLKSETSKKNIKIKDIPIENIIAELGTKLIIIVDEVDFIVLNARKSDRS